MIVKISERNKEGITIEETIHCHSIKEEAEKMIIYTVKKKYEIPLKDILYISQLVLIKK